MKDTIKLNNTEKLASNLSDLLNVPWLATRRID